MDTLAGALMAFPPDGAAKFDNTKYDRAALAHVERVFKALKEHKDLVHTHAASLIQVGSFGKAHGLGGST